jgi:hypothetical protein
MTQGAQLACPIYARSRTPLCPPGTAAGLGRTSAPRNSVGRPTARCSAEEVSCRVHDQARNRITAVGGILKAVEGAKPRRGASGAASRERRHQAEQRDKPQSRDLAKDSISWAAGVISCLIGGPRSSLSGISVNSLSRIARAEAVETVS